LTVGVVVLAHRGPEQLAALLSALRHPDVRLYVHLDRRAPERPFRDAVAAADGLRDVVWVKRHASKWGTIHLVDATLEGLFHAARDGCDYAFLISGQDYPLRPVEEIVEFAERAGTTSYVEHWPIPTPKWPLEGRDRTDFYAYTVFGRLRTCVPRGEPVTWPSWRSAALNELLRLRSAFKPPRRHPAYAQPYGGAHWLNLSRPAIEHVRAFVADHPDFRSYHRHTLFPEELFFQTILLGTDFEHEVVPNRKRFMIWLPGATHPLVLTEAHVPLMVASEDLFARKFDWEQSAGALAALADRVSA